MTTLDDLAGFLDAMTAEPDEPSHRNALQDWMQDAGLWTEADLRRLICVRPDLDGLKLNYADWCKQTGRCFTESVVRRELAILMVQWAGTDKGPIWGPNSTIGFLRQELEILHDVATFVTDRLPRMTQAIIRMGSVEQVWTTCTDWLANGPALVAQQPIVAVRLTDKEPVEQEVDGELWGRSNNCDHVGGAHWIPGCIHDFLPLNPRGSRFWHPVGKGRAHLSRACVAFARAQAGLQPLREVTP